MSNWFSWLKYGLPGRKRVRPLVLSLSLLLMPGGLLGCTLFRQAFAPEPLPVLDVRTFDRNVSLRHRVNINYGEREFSLQTMTEWNDERMVIAGLSSYSTTLFTIRVNRSSMEVESDADLPINLRRFATDLQWALWPSISDRDGMTVRTQDVDKGIQRILLRNGERIATITASRKPPWSGDVQFSRTAGYSMQLTLVNKKSISSAP